MSFTLAKFFYKFIFLPIIFPCFLLTFFGKPTLFIKIINKIIHFEEPIKKFEIFNLIFGFCLIFSAFAFTGYKTESKKLNELRGRHRNDVSFEEALRNAHSSERNFYIYLCGCLMLLIIHKFTERYLRVANLEDEIYKKKKELDTLVPQKSNTDKKKD